MLRQEVRTLKQRGVSGRGIARQTGLDRTTVAKWLATDPGDGAAASDEATLADAPAGAAVAPAPAVPQPAPPGPPAPWNAWSTVRQAGADLGRCRFLLLKRPAHLTAEEHTRLATLLASPLGAPLPVARDFLVDWYAIWHDAAGQRRSLVDATARWQQWRGQPTYQAVPPLRRVQQKIDEARFIKLRQFLREPHWEATNNGAERMGRAFRHQQAPHFTLRTTSTLEDDLKAEAFRRKEAGETSTGAAARRCTRGRKPRPAAVALAA